jgi:hypothetical protein
LLHPAILCNCAAVAAAVTAVPACLFSIDINAYAENALAYLPIHATAINRRRLLLPSSNQLHKLPWGACF